MPKPFDATTKHLLESDPGAWMALASLAPDGPLTVLDTDLSTVSNAADGVYRVDGPEPWLVHFEFQSSADRTLGARLLRYNILLGDRHDLPVQSVVILLRPEADRPTLTGIFERRLPDGRLCHHFHYCVVRIWERPVEEILQADLALLPMAPLSAVPPEGVPGVLRRIDDRLCREATPDEAETLWTALFVLMGLRYPKEFTDQLSQGVRAMIDVRESSFYQLIVEEGLERGRTEGLERGRTEGLMEGLEKGRLEEAIRLMRDLGRKRFGSPTADVLATIEGITSRERAERLVDRLLDATGWDDLLATP